MENSKKPFYKRWYGITLIIFGALFVIGLIQQALESPEAKAKRLAEEHVRDSIAQVEQQNYAAKREQEKIQEQIEKANEGEISMEKFEQIQSGMDKSEVDRLLGNAGKLTTSTDFGDNKIEVYHYVKTGLIKGKLIIVTFNNKKVSSKSQGGL